MARINLLPWREERRKQRNKEAQMVLVFAALIGFGIAGLAWFQTSRWIEGQNARNGLLKEEIRIADQKIKEIEALDRTHATLVKRQEVIEQLQADRSVMVHLFDELVRRTPEGARLTAIKQTGSKLTLEGFAESNSRVSEYMRSLDQSQWFGDAELSIVEARGEDRRERYAFSLGVNLKKPGAPDNDEAAPEGAPATATAAAPQGGSTP